MRLSSRLLLPVCLVLVSACASGGSRTQTVRANSSVITQEEIAQTTATTAYQLVQSLRPQWVRPRPVQNLSESTHTRPVGSGRNASGDVSEGRGTITVPNAGQPQVLVYMGQARLGDIRELHQIPATGVARVEFLDPAKADFRFGRGHTHGVILITPK